MQKRAGSSIQRGLYRVGGPHNVTSHVWAGVAQTVQIRSEAAALRADAAAPDLVYVRALDCGLCAVKNVIVNSDITLKETVAYTHVHDHAHAQSRTRTHAHQH